MTGYIMGLRARLGSQPLMQVGASVLVVDEDGRLLLQRRGDNGSWAYAGGSVELYEHVEAAARRELAEETGLIARDLELFGVFSGPEMAHVYPNGDQVSNIDLLYVCRSWEGELTTAGADPGEVLELGFFAPDALPEPIFAPNRPGLAAWLEAGGYIVPWS